MNKYFFTLIVFLMSCTPTDPGEIHDDLSVLQDFINNSPDIDLGMDINSNDVIEPLELGVQIWENGRITLLKCYNKGLSGSIPESIGNLTELTQLTFKGNNLSGEIPESIGYLTKLTQLNLADNALSGSIPETIGNLKSLTNLDLSNNLLTGNIPNRIEDLMVLHTFFADSNNFSGTLPIEICTIYPHFINFNIAGNQFCPPHAQPYCLDSPEKVGYQDCECGEGYEFNSGYCYSLIDLNVLQTMIDSSNSLNIVMDMNNNGDIEPLELGHQEWSFGRFKSLDCYWDTVSCNLSITLPENLSLLDSLRILDLQNNSLHGYLTESLVSSLDQLLNFSLLDITGNQFSGYLPANICNIDLVLLEDNHLCPCYPDCDNGIITSDTYQDITGCSVCSVGYVPICGDRNENHTGQDNANPHSFDNFTAESICFNQSDLNILQAFIDSSGLTLNMNMDIDSSGTIEELELGDQSWTNGELISLKASNIGLSGAIPDSIEYLDQIDTLYLHDNQLNGIIPDGICTLTNVIWSADSSAESTAFLYNNALCPPYPDCIAPYVGVQDTCQTDE